MPPERFQPKNDEHGAEDCRPEHYLQGDKRLIPTRREPGQLHFQKIQLVHDLREIIAGLGGLAEGEAVGIEVACVAVGLPLLVAYCRLIPDYREWLRTLISRMKRHSRFSICCPRRSRVMSGRGASYPAPPP
jgi:hypothetical protein